MIYFKCKKDFAFKNLSQNIKKRMIFIKTVVFYTFKDKKFFIKT